MADPSEFDVGIVGGGPAGLSAALVLGRCRRNVVLIDEGRPRNQAARKLHGFLSRDGFSPKLLLHQARKQLQAYPSVHIVAGRVIAARRLKGAFEIDLGAGRHFRGRRLLLATGMVDELPPIDGIERFYGRSVFHCPYCDGWEVRDQPLAVYGKGADGFGLASTLRLWSDDIVVCTDGAPRFSARQLVFLNRRGIVIRRERLLRVEGSRGRLKRLVFETGLTLRRSFLFFKTPQFQHSDLAKRLGCKINREGGVQTNESACTSEPGIFLAGDASREVQLAIIAAAEGAKAAFAINKSLLEEDDETN